MATTIKFQDGSTFPVASVVAGQTYLQSAQRKTLEIRIKKADVAFSALDAATQSSATFTINDGTSSSVYDNYSIRDGLTLKSVVTVQATNTTAAQTEEQYIVTLAQLSYIELNIPQMQTQIEALTLASLGVK